jgi:hypothetical protein
MKTLFILIAFLIIGHSSFSQAIDNVHTLHDQYTLEKSRLNALDPGRYSQIAGSPYLSEEFVKGEVIINDSIHYEEIPLRYNIFSDRMEYIDAQERVLEVNTAMHRFVFNLDDRIFRLLQYNDGTGIKRGMLEVMVDGETRLYRKYNMAIVGGTLPTGYQGAKPTRFNKTKDQFFIATGGRIPVLITKRKDLIKNLEAVNPRIDQYLKTNQVRLSSEQSLIDIVEYTNNHSQ